MDLLGLISSESSTGTPGTWGGAELSGMGAKAGGVVFSQTEVLAKAIVPFLGPPPTYLAGRPHI